MNTATRYHRRDLVRIAVNAMTERGLEPEFSAKVLEELATITGPGQDSDPHILNLTALPWSSIDNDDSLDLDQLTACEELEGGAVKILVAVADVDALVKKGSAIDGHAHTNTTSVYTSARIFPMLPERLSTDLTSLNPHQDRLAIVTEMVVNAEGAVTHSMVIRAKVRNHAQLAYDAVAAWIEGEGDLPEAAVFDGERVVDLRQQEQNRARQLIEEFMIATNTCTAQFLAHHGGASLRRVVRSPERWLRIVEVARKYGATLPHEPDSRALEGFLARQRKADPLRFPDLSLVIIKLMGSGEYVVEHPQRDPIGHFGLAVRDYTHSTAPNRRYPDLISMRMVKAMLSGARSPYGVAELEALALHCTQQEDAAQKVERSVRKSEAALYLQPFIGKAFDAIVTGRSDSATWVRTLAPPAEGLLLPGGSALDVGQRLRVKLVSANVERGFIDYEQVH